MNGDIHTSSNGQVFDAVELKGTLYVHHDDVIIRRSRLVGSVNNLQADATGLIIEDSDIHNAISIGHGFTARRNHVYAREGDYLDDGFKMGEGGDPPFAPSSVLLEDNRIDGMRGSSGSHLDGIQTLGGRDVVIRHNWVDSSSPPIEGGGGVNAAIFVNTDVAGDLTNATIECNMIIQKPSHPDDGFYPLRINYVKGDVIVRANRFARGFNGSAPVDITGTPRSAFKTWEDNAYVDGEVIPLP